MLKRWIMDEVETALTRTPAVALLGPRQVGKTTLAHKIGATRDAIYLDLESPRDLIKLSKPVDFLESHRDKLVILDEIQRAPDLFKALRGLIDQNRARGKKASQFLLLGSASMDLMRQSSESLAGRISYIEMSGLTALEIKNNEKNIRNLWVRGGFPDSYLAKNDDVSMDWLENLIRTYLERDVPQMGFRLSATKLRRLWTMLAHLQGEVANYSKLAGNLEMDGKSIRHYIDVLADLLLVRRLMPWHTNVKKRLVKSPRYYIRDSGITHRLLGIDSHDDLLSNPVLGKSWEGFVMENIHAILPRRAETYFYRTGAGAEIDLVIRFSASETWAIEIKHGTTPKINPRFSETCEDVGATRKYIVYGGNDEFPVHNDVTMISLERIMEKISHKRK